MAKEKQVKTNAMHMLDRNKIKYSVNFYEGVAVFIFKRKAAGFSAALPRRL